MAYVPLEVTLLSAHDLDETDPWGISCSSSSMEVYAVVYLMIGGDVYAMQRTPPDAAGGNNPEWGFAVRFALPREDLHLQDLVFSLLCSTSSPRCVDYGVGNVRVSLEKLLVLAAQSKEGAPPWVSKFCSPVTTPWGWQRGTLRFRVRFGEKAPAARREGAAAAAAAARSLEWVPTGVPSAPPAPLPLVAKREASPPVRALVRRRSGNKLVPSLPVVLLVASLLLLLCVVLSVAHLAGRLPSPLTVILVYGHPALQPPVPTPAPAAPVAHPRWPAILLLGGLLAAIRFAHGDHIHDFLS